MSRGEQTTHHSIHPGPDDPLRLEDAVKLAFPFGGMTVSGLRREAARGRLVFERIAGKQFVTLRAINQMRAECREDPKVPASTSDNATAANPFMSFSTEKTRLALAAAEMIARALKKPSLITSEKSTGPSGSVVTLEK